MKTTVPKAMTRTLALKNVAASLLTTLALLTFCINAATAQGVLTSGWTYSGTIAPIGHADSWTFPATNGDSIVIRMGRVTSTNNFTPRIRLFNPASVQQALASDPYSAEIAVTATNTGTFTVIADDANGTTATGAYLLTLAETGDPIVVAPGYSGGSLTNGFTYQASIPVGDLNVWDFTANAGQAFVVRAGELSSTNDFFPWMRVYGPDGSFLGSEYGLGLVEVTFHATNSGTFMVVIANNPYYSSAGDGTYRLTLAETGDPIVVAPGYSGGSLTNGFTYQANMPVGDLNVWDFTANAGQAIVVRAGESSSTNDFEPWVRVYGPDGTLLGSSFGNGFGEVVFQATNSGTFQVVVGNNPYYSGYGDGTYLLTLAETGDPIVLAPGYAGGPLTNGFTYQANMPIADLNVWDFTANAGQAIVVRAGESSSTNDFEPWVRVYGPDGTLLGSSFGNGFGEVVFQATNSGTFQVVIANNPYYNELGNGTYLLTLAETGDPIVLAPGYAGGPLTNGFTYQANMPVADLNVWDFTANAGQAIVVRAGESSSTNDFEPWVRVYGPDGTLLGSSFGNGFGEVVFRATNSGTFQVVIANNPYYSELANGTYLLTLAETGYPIVVAPGYDGGPLTNGFTYQANIPIGDLNVWDFTANAGQAIVLRAGESSSTNDFEPWVRVYGPDGSLLGSSFGNGFAEVVFQATNSGTFQVVIANNPYYSDLGNGTYLLTLAETGSPLMVAPGFQGGSLTGAGVYSGNLAIGEIDPWTFTICAGEAINVRAELITSTNDFDPWVRVYGPNGALLGSSFGTPYGEVAVKATNSGTFLVVIGNNPYYSDTGNGAYQMIVNGLSDGFKTCAPVISGTNLNVGGVGGPPGTNAVLLTTTNLTTPAALWTPIVTNQFNQFGVFEYSNEFNHAELQQYFRLSYP